MYNRAIMHGTDKPLQAVHINILVLLYIITDDQENER
jgi:hypothetical protein